MKHLFVPYELALLAKEKGFDEPCLTNFNHNKNFDTRLISDVGFCDCANRNLHKGCVSAPLYQQIVDWFRDVHKILILPDIYSRAYSHASASPNFVFKFKISDHVSGEWYCKESKDYYQALNAALTEAFKLINP